MLNRFRLAGEDLEAALALQQKLSASASVSTSVSTSASLSTSASAYLTPAAGAGAASATAYFPLGQRYDQLRSDERAPVWSGEGREQAARKHGDEEDRGPERVRVAEKDETCGYVRGGEDGVDNNDDGHDHNDGGQDDEEDEDEEDASMRKAGEREKKEEGLVVKKSKQNNDVSEPSRVATGAEREIRAALRHLKRAAKERAAADRRLARALVVREVGLEGYRTWGKGCNRDGLPAVSYWPRGTILAARIYIFPLLLECLHSDDAKARVF